MINFNNATRKALAQLRKQVDRIPLSYLYDSDLNRTEDGKYLLSYLDALSDWIHSDYCECNGDAIDELIFATATIKELIDKYGL